jgi:hypothetical protein
MIQKYLSVRTRVASIAAFGLLMLITQAYCQESHEHGHMHDSKGVALGTSVGYVHLLEEDENALGIHLHLMKRLGENDLRKHFSVGLGTEVIFADHRHYAAMISLEFFPYHGLVLSVSPGSVWANHDGEWESNYSTHAEAAYTFEVNEYDFGPAVGYSKTADDEHFMIGIHVGLHLQ